MPANITTVGWEEPALPAVNTSSSEVIEVISAFQVLLLQAGLALIESAKSRRKNTGGVLIRQLICLLLSTTAFWITGYAFTFGGSHVFIGWEKHFALSYTEESRFGHFFLHAAVAATPVSILGGALAERSHITGHLILCPIISGLLYPIVAHWVWDKKGWLYQHNVVDVGGVIPVHVFAGAMGLVGCLITGNRHEKLGQNFSTSLPGHSLPLGSIGGALVFVGLVGKATGLGAGTVILGQVAMNCVLAAAGGGIVTVLIYKLSVSSKIADAEPATTKNKKFRLANRRWSFYACLNGALAGLVAVQGGAGHFYPWGAYVTGVIAAIFYFLVSRLHIALRLDDPTDAVAIHLVPGFWGAIAVPLFSYKEFVELMGDRGFEVGWQIAGALTCLTWAAGTTAILLFLLLLIGKLRVAETVEKKGMDIVKVEEQAYGSCYEEDGHKEGGFAQFKIPGISPIKTLSRKQLLPNSRKASCTAVVAPNLNHNLTSTQKLESQLEFIPLTHMKELNHSAPVLIEESHKGLECLTVPPPAPPSYCPAITISSPEDKMQRGDSAATRPVLGPQTVLSAEELRATLRDQMTRLKETADQMRKPSASLLQRRDPERAEERVSLVSLKEGVIQNVAANPANFNYFRPPQRQAEKKWTNPEEVTDDVFQDTDDSIEGNEESCFEDDDLQEKSCIEETESALEKSCTDVSFRSGISTLNTDQGENVGDQTAIRPSAPASGH